MGFEPRRSVKSGAGAPPGATCAGPTSRGRIGTRPSLSREALRNQTRSRPRGLVREKGSCRFFPCIQIGSSTNGDQEGCPLSFECSQCGECCSHLGLVHTIHIDYGNYRYLIRNQYTGETTEVSIDPDKISLFADTSIFSERPEACPFFRYDAPAAKGFCTVHLTRPEICRDYGCWRLLILDGLGRRAGRIMGRRHLASEDAALARLFEEEINRLVEPDDAAWDRHVIEVLVRAGYTVRT